MRRLSVWIDLIGMGQALAGHGPASGPASGARKRSGRTLQRPRPWWSSRNACEQFSAEMLESGQFPSRARSRAHRGVGRSPLVHWRLLTRLLHSPVVVWSWFCDIKITIPPLPRPGRRERGRSLRALATRCATPAAPGRTRSIPAKAPASPRRRPAVSAVLERFGDTLGTKAPWSWPCSRARSSAAARNGPRYRKG